MVEALHTTFTQAVTSTRQTPALSPPSPGALMVALQGELEDARAEVETVRAQAQDAEQRMQSLQYRAQLDGEAMTSLRTQVADMQGMLEEAQEAANELKAQQAALQESTVAAADVAALRSARDAALSEVEALRKRVTTVEAELAGLRNKLHNLSS